MANVQREFTKHKVATIVVSVDKREKANVIVFKLRQQVLSGDEMKSLKTEREILKETKFYIFQPSLINGEVFAPKARWAKVNLISFKHQILLHCKHHAVE